METVAMFGRLLVDVLQRAYNSHMEHAQMRLAPVKPRSWRDIPRAERTRVANDPAAEYGCPAQRSEAYLKLPNN
jgi:hypothetical protein